MLLMKENTGLVRVYTKLGSSTNNQRAFGTFLESQALVS